MNKHFWNLAAATLSFVAVSNAQATDVSYGDLYNIEWCPCNSEERFDADGSVVMGRTVMCPCNSRYSGYKKGWEQDIREIKQNAVNQLRQFGYFQYYLGAEYNFGTVTEADKDVVLSGSDIPSGRFGFAPKDIVDSQDSIALIAGMRFSKHVGFELFYQQSCKDNKSSISSTQTIGPHDYNLTGEFATGFKAYGFDFNGYIPVSSYFDFVGILGVAQYKLENSLELHSRYTDHTTGINHHDIAKQDFNENKIGWRVGAGVQLNITNHIAIRGMYKYISLGSKTIDNMNDISVGLRFVF